MPEDVDLYYADESGFEQYYSRNYGYALSSKRVYGDVYGQKFARTSIVSALKDNKMVAPFAFSGCMNGDLFEGWLETVFVPCLVKPEKSILVIDNAPFHRKNAIYDIADEYGFSVVFLPPYSPDLNPIEIAWANIKNWLRQHLLAFPSFWDALIHAFS